MALRKLTAIATVLVGGASLTAIALSQSSYDEKTLAAKRRLARAEIAALAEPYRGVLTSSGLETSLLPVRSTGVTAEPIREEVSSPR